MKKIIGEGYSVKTSDGREVEFESFVPDFDAPVQKYYKVIYTGDTFAIHKAPSSLALIKRLDLASKEHINTRVIQLEGEQLAIAIANDQAE